MANLRLSNDIMLPAEAVTETFAILAKHGVGKTYTASVLVFGGLRRLAECAFRQRASV
jgi:hypothetical protein